MSEPHPVMALLRERATHRTRPGARADGQRLALALEGGAMRGVVSAGMASALERRRLLDCFDLVVGTSAGALNAAAFLAGVVEGCLTAYHGAFATRRFINPYRLLIGRAAIDVAFTLDHVDEWLDAARHSRTVERRPAVLEPAGRLALEHAATVLDAAGVATASAAAGAAPSS